MRSIWLGMAVIVACVVFSTPVADAAVVFGYQVNSSPEQGRVIYDGSSLTMQSAGTTVDFAATNEQNGQSFTYAGASISLDAQLVDSQSVNAAGTLKQFDGSLAFEDSSGDSIVSYTFEGATLVLPTNASSAALTWSSSVTPGTITSGSALDDELLDPGLYLTSPADFGFSLTGISPAGDPDGFTARTSFSGQATVIPEPTSAALLGLAATAMLRRRRRKA